MQLTLEQQKLVEKNHNLIYGFIHKNNLDLDYWYDILAIKLCECVQSYDEDKSQLSTYVYKCFRYAVGKHIRDSKADKRKANNMASEIFDINMPATQDFEESIYFKAFFEKHKDDKILNLKLKGYTQKQIGDMIGISQAMVSRRLAELRREYKNYDEPK